MVYEWDAKRARRTHWLRMGLGVLAVVFIVAVPLWIAVSMDVI